MIFKKNLNISLIEINLNGLIMPSKRPLLPEYIIKSSYMLCIRCALES